MKKIITLIALIVGGLTSLQAQIFYKIESKGKTAPSYIFGSHHLAPISVVEASGAMKYLDKVSQVVGEIDMGMDQIAMAMALLPYMTAPADSTLSVLLAGEDMEALNAQFQKWAPMPGMTLQMLDGLKPMAVSTMIAAGMSAESMPGFDPSQQLDAVFLMTGSEKGKKIIGLETPEYQGEILFNMTPLSIQAEALVDLLKNPQKAVDDARKLSAAYLERNMDTLLEVTAEEDEHPEFMEAVLYRRNAEWLQKLPSIIEEAPTFIVVGALHLAGERGLLEGLRARGFKVTPIY